MKKPFLFLNALLLLVMSASSLIAKELPVSETRPYSKSQSSKVKEDDKWPIYFEIEGKKGNYRDLMRFQGMFPVWQDPDTMLFLDARLMMDSIKDREGNIGIGYRKIFRNFKLGSEGVILGAHAFFDRRRSSFHNWFNQGVFGVEALAEHYQVHFNYYKPQNKSYYLGTNQNISFLVPGWRYENGNAILTFETEIDLSNQREYALKGYDGELKVKVPFNDKFHVWLGGMLYRFTRGSLIKSEGKVGMADLEVMNLFGQNGSRASLGIEYRRPKNGKDIKYGVLRFGFPLYFDKDTAPLKGIDYEMTRFIQRDVDINTSGATDPDFNAEPISDSVESDPTSVPDAKLHATVESKDDFIDAIMLGLWLENNNLITDVPDGLLSPESTLLGSSTPSDAITDLNIYFTGEELTDIQMYYHDFQTIKDRIDLVSPLYFSEKMLGKIGAHVLPMTFATYGDGAGHTIENTDAHVESAFREYPQVVDQVKLILGSTDNRIAISPKAHSVPSVQKIYSSRGPLYISKEIQVKDTIVEAFTLDNDGKLEPAFQLGEDLDPISEMTVGGFSTIFKGYGEYDSTFGFDQIFSVTDSQASVVAEVPHAFNCIGSHISALNLSKLIGLKELECSRTRITSLDISKNTNLESLDCSWNSLGALRLTNNPNLKYLSCRSILDETASPLVLDLSENTLLETIDVSINKMVKLDLKKNTALTNLEVRQNALTSLYLSKNTNLKDLDVSHTNLASIDLKDLTNLEVFVCGSTPITDVDLSKNVNLKTLALSLAGDSPTVKLGDIDSLVTVDVSDSNIKSFDLTNQADLKYFQCNKAKIKELDFSNKEKLEGVFGYLGELESVTFGNNPLLKYVFFQDNKIETIDLSQASALERVSLNNNAISSITLNNPDLISLEINNNNLTSLDISGLANLRECECADNALTSFKMGGNTNLEGLVLVNSQLTSFDCSGAPNLSYLILRGNQLTSIDHLDQLTSLNELVCDNNQLTSLSLPVGAEIYDIDCSHNKIKSLDVKGYPLYEFLCHDNHLEKLDLAGMTQLEMLSCENNQISDLDLSGITTLSSLSVQNNKLEKLDLSANPYMFEVYCQNNLLKDLNVTKLYDLERLDCSGNKIEKLDLRDSQYLDRLYSYDNHLTELNITGIESLDSVLCYNNQLKTLDIGKSINLTSLNVSNNLIEALDLSKMENLEAISCKENKLKVLDIGHLTTLTSVSCAGNQIASLDLRGNDGLIEARASRNHLTSIKVNDLPVLENLACALNSLESLDVSGSGALVRIDCSQNNLSSIDLKDQVVLDAFSCYNNNFDTLSLGHIETLDHLDCSNNHLTALDVSKSTGLTGLLFSGNKLKGIDLSSNTELDELYCFSNQLEGTLDLHNNSKLVNLDARSNDLSTIIYSPSVETSNWLYDGNVNLTEAVPQN